MRRLLFMVFAVLAAACVVSLTTLSAQAQSSDQYEASDGAQSSDTPENTAPEESPSGASPSSDGSVSQGSLDAVSGSPEAVAAREDLAVEEGLPDYSQVVDNTTKGAFTAPGWTVRRGATGHGGSYVVAEKAKGPARFSVKVPSSNDYSVYAWWPANAKAGTTRIGVQGASGMKWDELDEGLDGGGWVKIGTYAMKTGKRVVQIIGKSTDGGQIAADAVAVVRGEAAPPEDQATTTASGQRSADATQSRARLTSGWQIVRQARRHIGDRYRYATCSTAVKSCTCLTRMAVLPFGHRMGMTEGGQWSYSRSYRVRRSALRPGDEVFFKEGNSRYITHVGIYSGNGRIVHASSYWGRVVEKEMRYIDGYFGAKRFRR
jgi:cell wall-associated NlpC family hydrolase